MLVYRFNNYRDIPGIDGFSEKIPIFATQNYADYIKDFKNIGGVPGVKISIDKYFNTNLNKLGI